MSRNKLIELVTNNSIREDNIYSCLYNLLVLSLFEHLIYLMKDSNVRKDILSSFRRTTNHLNNVKKIVRQYTGCNITDNECQMLLDLLFAYFRKNGIRKKYSTSQKQSILEEQDCKCNICGRDIDLNNSELDHIVPWSFVGDELKHNLQLLCNTCNERKGKSVEFQLKMFLIKHNGSVSNF